MILYHLQHKGESMDVMIGFLLGAFTVWMVNKMSGWEKEETRKIESEDISEHGVDKD